MTVLTVDWGLHHVNWPAFLSIPIFTAVIGWLINWTGLIMLFAPLRFYGFKVPGLRDLIQVVPRKLQEVPGLIYGGVGWQGIIPARAAKMGSIAVDKVIAKLGTPREFYEQLDPPAITAHIIASFEPQIPDLVDEVMLRERPRLWRELPQVARDTVYDRVRAQLPTIIGEVTGEIGANIDQLLNPKLMVIDHFEQHPELVVRVFKSVGERELRMMVNFGFIFGFLFGIPVAFIDHWAHQWWLLPVMGVLVGWATNKVGMWLIFEPADRKRIAGIWMQGLFPRRQDAASEIYARIIADEVITMERIGDYLVNGPAADRTRALLAKTLAPVIDKAAGPLRGAVRVVVGAEQYGNIREFVTNAAIDRTLVPFRDPEFSRQQSDLLNELLAERTKQLPPPDFVEMMRSAFKEDEWMLYAHGAIMGLVGGFIHLWIFGPGGVK